MRTRKYKHKPQSHLSFVTRYSLCARIPEYEPSGFDVPKHNQAAGNRILEEFLKYLDSLEGKNEIRRNSAGASEGQDGSELDEFILNAAENINNNKAESPEEDAAFVTEIVNQKKENVSNSLENFFEKNRLEATYTSRIKPASKYVSLVNGAEIVTNPTIMSSPLSNTSFPSARLLDNVSDSDVDSILCSESGSQDNSQDTASTCSSSGTDTGVINSVSLTPSRTTDVFKRQGSGTGNTYVKTIKLRDVHLKLTIIDVAGGQRVIKCPDCAYVTTSIDFYVPHLREHMKNKNACFLCGKYFSRSWLLKGMLVLTLLFRHV